MVTGFGISFSQIRTEFMILPFKQMKMHWSKSDLSEAMSGAINLNYLSYQRVLFNLPKSSLTLTVLASWYRCTVPTDHHISTKTFARNF